MKIPLFNKSFSSSFSSNSNSSSWAWPSCHQNPKTKSFRATIIAISCNEVEEEKEDEENPLPAIISSSSSSYISSTIDAIEDMPDTESIENVIKGIKSSERLIFEHKGNSNSILEEMRNKNSCYCPWNQFTFSLISSGSWWRWLRYTRFIAASEASKCIVKTTE